MNYLKVYKMDKFRITSKIIVSNALLKTVRDSFHLSGNVDYVKIIFVKIVEKLKK